MRRDLILHPQCTCPAVTAITVDVNWATDSVMLTYVVSGDIAALRIPPPGDATRTDRLWQATCAELFVQSSGVDGYREYNFAPSGQWAAYMFGGYREGMTDARQSVLPTITAATSPDTLTLTVTVSMTDDPRPCRIGLSAVIEDRSGTRTYWALAHPAGAPDFHHPSTFDLLLQGCPHS